MGEKRRNRRNGDKEELERGEIESLIQHGHVFGVRSFTRYSCIYPPFLFLLPT